MAAVQMNNQSASNSVRSASTSPIPSQRRTTREQLLAMARTEYARQLSRFTDTQLRHHVPSCQNHEAYYGNSNSSNRKRNSNLQPASTASVQT
ncbi:hypothetical protein BCR43DRAFT_483989 [Syncephalastrum racemosum]|uniref:Uncharacterized protein n=1 Tax=Syncephalastrum racemosum TaxID=13706 RepID=A0A1X2HW97_SYNRA|nr:hypothetical protein BCR43DRAFT_483989 [Syncephalastrum racemosum]